MTVETKAAWTFGRLAVAAIVYLVATLAAFAQTPILSAQEAAQKLASGEIVVLDIRSPEEWTDTGLAKGAWPVSLHRPEFPQQLQSILAKYGPDRVALICATGGRTAYVAEILEKNGVSGVADVSEGMFGNGAAKGWIAHGLPIIPVEEAQAQFKAVQETWRQ